MQVEIWADVVCPWCYIGKRRFEHALARFAQRDDVEVVWRSFQLDPGAAPYDPARPAVDHASELGAKYGGGREAGLRMIAQVTQVATGEGLDMDLAGARGGNTRTAHRLLQAALASGGPQLQTALAERLMRGYFVQREPIADPQVLVRLAVEAGLDAALATEVASSSDAYDDQVSADVAQAAAFGAGGVPFFVVDRRYAVSGAQPVEVFEQVLARAQADRA
jgi:predicted DsbA family dithiol-disulfide isomerase